MFSLPFINYRFVLSAHSHLAFAGWAGLALITLLIYDLLPKTLAQKKIYSWVLAGMQLSSLGMAASFPFVGYNTVSIFFSTLYIVATVVFAPVFIKDLLRSPRHNIVKGLSIAAVASLILSFLGALGLVYILMSRSGNSILYRDSVYTFLHFQYNGFFTVAIMALLFKKANEKGTDIDKNAKNFALFLCLSIVPALFLSLLWHNKPLFYVLAWIGCICMLIALIYFFRFFKKKKKNKLFSSSST